MNCDPFVENKNNIMLIKLIWVEKIDKIWLNWVSCMSNSGWGPDMGLYWGELVVLNYFDYKFDLLGLR